MLYIGLLVTFIFFGVFAGVIAAANSGPGSVLTTPSPASSDGA